MTTLSITYGNVKRDVLRMSEYVGLKSGAHDQLRAIDSDDEQLRFWYREGLSLVGVLLDRLLDRRVSIDDVSDTATFVFSHVNDNLPQYEGAIQRVVVLHILVHWLKLVAPSLLSAYESDLRDSEQSLLRMCYFREMPK